MKMSKMWKVPFRQVYCESFGMWLMSTLWCHVVIKIFPRATERSREEQEAFMASLPR